MAFNKKTIRDIDPKGKVILVRADYNVPLDSSGNVEDDYRIEMNLPTLRLLLKKGAKKLVICSHLGRPDGRPDSRYSLKTVSKRLEKLMNEPVEFVNDCLKAEKGNSRIVLLENLRFHPEEEANDKDFAAKLTKGKDILVQDAFGAVHRAHASLDAAAKQIPAVAGLLLEKEVTRITEAVDKPAKPFVVVMGGAKIADKIDLIDNMMKKADAFIIGGAMANTFWAAQNKEIGKSRFDADDLDEAKRILDHAKKNQTEIYLPSVDVVIASSLDKPETARTIMFDHIKDEDMILDTGPRSVEALKKVLNSAKTIIWNGTMGVAEIEAFSYGSKKLAELISKTKAITIIGGGDTASFIDEIGMVDKFSHVSTGGGASLELMAGKKLPGIDALQNT